MNNDVLYWLWLQKSLGYGENISELVRFFGGAREIYEAGEAEWRKSGLFGDSKFEIKPKKIDAMKSISPEQCLDTIDYCEKHGIEIITPENSRYPALLKRIINYPSAIFVKGDLSCLDNSLAIGVVGTRKPSAYGIEAAEKISHGLAKENAVIVSGGALGIDCTASKSAIEAGGKTIIVMGCGHDVNYLMDNEPLRQSTCKHGALVTEYPPLTKPSLWSFPKRNRIISGLSSGVVIIEAGERSGTLNTANHAKQQNRDIFVIPGDISSEAYRGSNRLIVEGASAVFSATDILKYYEYEVSAIDEINSASKSGEPFTSIDRFNYGKEDKHTKRKKTAKESTVNDYNKQENINTDKKFSEFNAESVSNNAKIVYNLMSSGLTSLDEITRESNLPVRKVLTALTELEMENAVIGQSGNRYVLKTAD